MKILITGSSGQLGREIINNSDKSHQLLMPSRSELDLSNEFNCQEYLEKHKPDFIINSGAFTDVDKAEIQKDLCYSINAKAPTIFANVLKKYGGKLLQINTDYVFDGKKNCPYQTNDLKNPISIYGYTKSEAESISEKILRPNGQIVILRTSWLMGHIGANFIKKMLELHKKGERFSVVYDQIGSMTSTTDLSKVCWEIVENWNLFADSHHICHWTCSGVSSWYDIAMEIGLAAKKFNILEKSADILPIRSIEYKTLANRPNYSILDSSSTRELINIPHKYWRRELDEILLKIETMNKNS